MASARLLSWSCVLGLAVACPVMAQQGGGSVTAPATPATEPGRNTDRTAVSPIPENPSLNLPPDSPVRAIPGSPGSAIATSGTGAHGTR